LGGFCFTCEYVIAANISCKTELRGNALGVRVCDYNAKTAVSRQNNWKPDDLNICTGEGFQLQNKPEELLKLFYL
jgi:hypothetical protein